MKLHLGEEFGKGGEGGRKERKGKKGLSPIRQLGHTRILVRRRRPVGTAAVQLTVVDWLR